MKNIGQMMKQAQQMQARMEEMQQKLGAIEITGQAGAGLVQVTLTGKGEARSVKLAKSAVDPEDLEVLEDLLVAAINDARNKIETHVAEETGKLMGGMQLPAGFKLPF